MRLVITKPLMMMKMVTALSARRLMIPRACTLSIAPVYQVM
jgi:hypothetical protein